MNRILALAIAGLGAFVALLGARRIATDMAVQRGRRRPLNLSHVPGALDDGDQLWRGPAPVAAGYAELADAGVSLIVDLRVEAESAQVGRLTRDAGLDLLHLKIRDGSSPTPGDLRAFGQAVANSIGITYVHCRAGEGRTGAIVGALRVRDGLPVMQAIFDALGVGSLTFAQLTYVASAGEARRLVALVDLLIDKPTEFVFNQLRD